MIQYGSSKGPQNQSEDKASQGIRSRWIQEKNQPPSAKLKVPQKDLLIFFRQLSVVLQSGGIQEVQPIARLCRTHERQRPPTAPCGA